MQHSWGWGTRSSPRGRKEQSAPLCRSHAELLLHIQHKQCPAVLRQPWAPEAVAVGSLVPHTCCCLRKLHLTSTFFPCGIAAACSLLDFEHLRSESVSRPKPLASFLWVFLFCCEIYAIFFLYKPSRLVFFDCIIVSLIFYFRGLRGNALPHIVPLLRGFRGGLNK